MKKKIIFIISELSQGGTQKTVQQLISKCLIDSFEVCVITFEKEKKINLKNLKYYALNLKKKSGNKFFGMISNIKRIFLIREVLKKNEGSCIISFLPSTNILVILANIFINNKLIIAERNNPKNQPIDIIWKLFRRIFYRFPNKIICNSRESLNYFQTYYPKKKIMYIPNYVNLQKQIRKKPSKIILSIGRMHFQKGFDILINGFEKSCARSLGWKLVIIGNGSEKMKLSNLINKLNLKNYVKLINFTNPYKWYKKANIFVLLSRYEGTPNVVLEAASQKIPIIISRGTGGALDFIKNNKSGLVLKRNSADEACKSINLLIKNSNLGKKFANQAFKKIKYFSNIETIYMSWKKVITQ